MVYKPTYNWGSPWGPHPVCVHLILQTHPFLRKSLSKAGSMFYPEARIQLLYSCLEFLFCKNKIVRTNNNKKTYSQFIAQFWPFLQF